jgi:hypothetical protein|tara:strand:+ start:30 stop:869 length:840 start_codon:yes stop_codon:yes gene_type:complete
MAKKTKVEVEEPQIKEEMVVETPPVMDIPEPKKETHPEDGWEIKDRVYYLKGNQKPLSKLIRGSNIFWFDKEKGYQRELKYCQNQQTCFVDEMKGEQRLSHIIFRSGALFVPKQETVLQKLLSLYHPHKDKVYYEFKPAAVAEEQIDVLEREADAIIAARNIDIEQAEAIMRTEIGSKVSKMSSSELKRDLLIFARRNPELFLQLIQDDNVQLRNFGIKAVELGIIKISSDQRNFLWSSNNRKLMTIPFDEHPYSALAAWFKTDEGMEIHANIKKRLNN